MPSYYSQKGKPGKRKIRVVLRSFFILVFLAMIAVAAYVVYDTFRQSDASTTASDSTTPVTTTIQTDSVLQRTPYFEFYAPRKWRPLSEQTRDGHYVFREMNNQTGGQEIVVEVNQTDTPVMALVQTTRVLPVIIGDLGELITRDLSDHCNKAVPGGGNRVPQMVTYKKVTFACSLDGRLYNAVVGLEGGTTNIPLERPDGSTATYRISYRNFTANPNSGDLISIVKSFRTR